MKKCNCNSCQERKDLNLPSGRGLSNSYNRLEGEAAQFARNWGMGIGEFCIRNKGRRFKPPQTDFERRAGNRSFGFPTRHTDQDPCKMVVGLDGQYKSARKTVCRPRKNICRLASNRQVSLAILKSDPEVWNKMMSDAKKIKRKFNRNPKARRGHRKNKRKGI